ncbi:uncharacterized protein LOC131640196 [Vicia villosa]|uniref:uncharacterized protein LOC131640196 n=1 Tax=Vicia villosa TaxID=3911 RepID=UPI00273ACA25|nr:uncharacterized protein LOC131640196 [Vicia villosa]
MEKMEDESPRNKVKFLCSYGGKVLPRPSDGVLKYVGGETRVICIPRDVTFADMMKKVSGVVDGEVVLKYQVIPEELDTLVTVRTEDDLKHMITELDRHESGGSPLLRAFLFPLKPLIVDNQSQMQMQQVVSHPPPIEPYFLEQRYLDAINGIVRQSPGSKFAAFSACSSPKSTSPEGCTPGESPFHHQGMPQLPKGMVSMQRVRSSPSLSSLTSTYNNTQPLQQPPQPHNHGISRSRSSHYQHQHHPLVGLKPIQEVGMGMGMGRVSPSQMSMNMMTDNMSSSSSSSRGMNYYYTNANRPHKAYPYHDDSVGHVVVERVQSVPRSPRPYLGE